MVKNFFYFVIFVTNGINHKIHIAYTFFSLENRMYLLVQFSFNISLRINGTTFCYGNICYREQDRCLYFASLQKLKTPQT